MSSEYNNPSFDALSSGQIAQALAQVRTAMPARVVSFNPATQTATLEAMTHNQTADGGSAPIPPLADVPVQFPRAGGFVITFPVRAGDEGIAIIADRCIDGWHSTGGAGAPLTSRSHDLSDAMFIPGFNSVGRATTSFDMDAVVVRSDDGKSYMKIDAGGNLEFDGAQATFKCPVIIEKLLTYQQGISGTGGGGGNSISGDLIIKDGDVTADNIGLKAHHHIDSMNGATTESKT